VQALLADGYSVRCLARDPARVEDLVAAGCQIVRGDICDLASRPPTSRSTPSCPNGPMRRVRASWTSRRMTCVEISCMPLDSRAFTTVALSVALGATENAAVVKAYRSFAGRADRAAHSRRPHRVGGGLDREGDRDLADGRDRRPRRRPEGAVRVAWALDDLIQRGLRRAPHSSCRPGASAAVLAVMALLLQLGPEMAPC
jgi:hypothetical protein